MNLRSSRMMVCSVTLTFFVGSAVAEKMELKVKILDHQSHDTSYTYFVPAQFTARTNSTANCFGTDATVNCSGTATTTGTSTAAHSGSFDVKGATFSLQLPDGRIAVVNCDSKFAEHFAGPAGNHRNCRVPLVDEIQAEFDGDKAKLKWPVSIDGRKMETETYKILGILPKP
jgi:hypothetical protein